MKAPDSAFTSRVSCTTAHQTFSGCKLLPELTKGMHLALLRWAVIPSLWVWHTAYSKYGECRQTFWIISSELNQSWKTRLGFTALAGEWQRMSMSFLTSSLNLPGHSFEPFPHVLSPNTTEKSGNLPEITVRDTHYASVHSHHVLALLSREGFVLTWPAGTTLLCGICRLHKFMENSSWLQGLWQGKTRHDRNAHA